MKKSIKRMVLSFMCILLLTQSVSAAEALIPGGQIIGIALEDGSISVAAFDEALGENAKAAGLQVGDRITHIDDQAVSSVAEIRKALEQSDGTVEIRLEREGKQKQLSLRPNVTSDGPRLGVYLKQGVTGVGTVTWYDPETHTFGALGHGVNEPDGTPVAMLDGKVYKAAVASVKKGQSGRPGSAQRHHGGQRPHRQY